MMPFLTELDIVLVDDDEDLWKLDKALLYVDKYGRTYEVPAGFVCDLASIPRLPLTYLLFKSADTHRPGVLHDYLCRESNAGNFKRKHADQIFYEALRDDGVGAVRAKLMYWAVSLYSGISANRQ